MMLVKWAPEKRRQLINRIQQFFLDERGEEIGEIAAAAVLTFFEEELGPYFYNVGVKAATEQWEAAQGRMEEDLFSLLRPTK